MSLVLESARRVRYASSGSSHPRTEAAAQRIPAFDYLRAFVIALVVWHHVSMAYIGGGVAARSGEYTKATAPVVDPAQWSGFNATVSWNDGFFMPLMFLLAGLFVRPSLARKGVSAYLADRMRRLGVPLLLGIVTIVPLSYYASYLQSGGAAPFTTYWVHMVTVGPWPSGPLWFVGVLLVFDAMTALFLVKFGDRVPDLRTRASVTTCFLAFLILSAVLYLPVVEAVGSSHWLTMGPFGVQAARIGLYAIYFLAGVTVGADRLAAALEHKWLRWPMIAFAATALYFAVPQSAGDLATGATMLLFCAATAMGLLALAVRFGRRRSAIGDSLGANAYGIYLLHYPIVVWLQYLILREPLGTGMKAAVSMVAGFCLSWLGASLLRRLPGAERFI